MFGERHADPTQRGGMIQQPPPQGAGGAMSGMQRPRTAHDGRSQHGKQRPKGKERKGSQRQSGQGHGTQEAKYGHKTERQEAVGTRKTEGRRYERGGASDRGRYAWGRDTVYTPTCETAGDTDGHGSAQSGHPEDGGGDEGELLAAEMAKVKKLEAKIAAKMRQRQQEQGRRSGTKLRESMEQDDDDDQEGGEAVVAKSAEVTFDDDYDEFVMNVLEQDKSTGEPNQTMIEHENEVKKTEKFAIPQLEMFQGLKIKVSSPPERCCTPPNLVEQVDNLSLIHI